MTPCGGPAGVEADKIRTELGINYHMVRKESADPKLAVSCGPHCRTKIMRLTKKAAALLLAASLAVSVCATPVFATENMGSTPAKFVGGIGTGDTKVLYKVTESYTWTVPATIDFGEDAGVNNTSTVEANLGENKTGEKAKQNGTAWKGTAPKIMVTKNVIGVGKELQITFDTTYLAENGEFYVATPDGAEKLYYTVIKPAAPGGTGEKLTKTNTKVLSVPAGTNTAEQELVFTLTTAANNAANNAAEKAGSYEGHVVFQSKIV